MLFSHTIKLVLCLWSPWQTLLSFLAQEGDPICERHPVHTPWVTELGHCKNTVEIITQGKCTQLNCWKLYKLMTWPLHGMVKEGFFFIIDTRERIVKGIWNSPKQREGNRLNIADWTWPWKCRSRVGEHSEMCGGTWESWAAGDGEEGQTMRVKEWAQLKSMV